VTYPPQSHRFRTKLPRNRTCEYSTSTTGNKYIRQSEINNSRTTLLPSKHIITY